MLIAVRSSLWIHIRYFSRFSTVSNYNYLIINRSDIVSRCKLLKATENIAKQLWRHARAPTCTCVHTHAHTLTPLANSSISTLSRQKMWALLMSPRRIVKRHEVIDTIFMESYFENWLCIISRELFRQLLKPISCGDRGVCVFACVYSFIWLRCDLSPASWCKRIH